jgi:hypothetical protein
MDPIIFALATVLFRMHLVCNSLQQHLTGPSPKLKKNRVKVPQEILLVLNCPIIETPTA